LTDAYSATGRLERQRPRTSDRWVVGGGVSTQRKRMPLSGQHNGHLRCSALRR